ncbi:hypothetical protein C2E23DRAFT_829232 [Lenzites betulinus]|nr:hypothetical protein C2E23DRAFT_829232 [Lenzites betulinus]
MREPRSALKDGTRTDSLGLRASHSPTGARMPARSLRRFPKPACRPSTPKRFSGAPKRGRRPSPARTVCLVRRSVC